MCVVLALVEIKGLMLSSALWVSCIIVPSGSNTWYPMSTSNLLSHGVLALM